MPRPATAPAPTGGELFAARSDTGSQCSGRPGHDHVRGRPERRAHPADADGRRQHGRERGPGHQLRHHHHGQWGREHNHPGVQQRRFRRQHGRQGLRHQPGPNVLDLERQHFGADRPIHQEQQPGDRHFHRDRGSAGYLPERHGSHARADDNVTNVTFDSNANQNSYGGAINIDSGDLTGGTNIFRGTVQITGSRFRTTTR